MTKESDNTCAGFGADVLKGTTTEAVLAQIAASVVVDDGGAGQRALGALAPLRRDLDSDFEKTHVLADEAVIALLREVGYGEVADAWDAVGKGYS